MARRRSGARLGAGLKFTLAALVGAVLIAGAAGLILLQQSDSSSRAGSAGDDALSAGVRAGAGPAAGAATLFKRVSDSWNAAKHIEDLEKRNQQLETWRETALALSERLERYEALLNMPPEAYGVGANVKGAVSARLILDPGGPFKRTLLANAGADHGVKRGYVAVNENGLVGRVVTLGRRSSRVLMLDDYNSHVPVMGLQSRARAMLNGDASREPKLTTGEITLEPPRLEHQVPEGRLREGERIVTSGDGGVYPRGVLVGFATRDGSGAWRVKLAAASKPIDFVRLIPYTDGETPEGAPVADPGPPPPTQRLSFAGPVAPPPPPPITVRPAAPTTPPSDNNDVAPDAPEPSAAAPASAPSASPPQ